MPRSSVKINNYSMTTALETIVIIWFFYILLLFVYDQNILGEKHPITYIVCFGSLIWSIILMKKLLRFNNYAKALRYAIPTTVIFWNAIEIFGRWNLFREIWVEPNEFIIESIILILSFIGLFIYSFFEKKARIKV